MTGTENPTRPSTVANVLELTRELVETDSQNPGAMEGEVARLVDGVARSWGFESRIVETAPGRANVLITVDAGGPRSLAFSGHLDTKEVGGAAGLWETPPLKFVVDGGLAYGLGTSDMKGAVAAMLVAAERWSRRAKCGRLDLVFTADEESGGRYGAKALSEMGLVSADVALIGEPSGIDEPWEAMYLVSRGICRFDVVIEGTQGHSGLSERLPTSATIAAAKAVLALHEGLELDFDSHPDYDYRPTVNAGVRLEGGVYYGVHPGNATVGCDVRLVPGMRRERLEEEVQVVLSSALPADVSWSLRHPRGSFGWKDAVSIDPGHPLVEAAQGACEEVLGRRPPFAAYPGGTDATAFAGVAGVPTVASLGPGWLSVAHGPNERVGVDQLADAAELYESVAHRYLGSGA